MNIIIANGQKFRVSNVDSVPRKGDKICSFGRLSKVLSVIWYPTPNYLQSRLNGFCAFSPVSAVVWVNGGDEITS